MALSKVKKSGSGKVKSLAEPAAAPNLWDGRPDKTPATLADLRAYARALALERK